MPSATKLRPALLVLVALLIGLFVISRSNYLLFHSLVEVLSVLIAFSIFLLAWNSSSLARNDCLLVLGTAYLFVGALDLIHALSYKGMGVFPGHGSNLATQLWIAARYMESLSLLIAPFFLKRRVAEKALIASYAVVFGLLIASIFHWRVFPDSYVEGIGLTPFKKISEYMIAATLLLAAGVLARWGRELDKDVREQLVASVLISVAAELCFTLYTDVYGITNLSGHILKVLSFYFVYKAVIETGVKRPHALLFHELERSRDELEHRVDERTKEIKDKTARIEWQNRELEEVGKVASSDLLEPLGTIRTSCNLLLRESGAGFSEAGNRHVQSVIHAADRMHELVQALRSYSRAGTAGVSFLPIPLRGPVDKALENLRPVVLEKKASITVGDLPHVEADSSLMEELFRQLLDNALKFGRDDTLPIVEIVAKKVEPNEKDGAAWEIRVRDNGKGFAEEDRDKIFQPFSQLPESDRHAGTGIGLAICRRIVERHGGNLSAHGIPGVGSAFIVRLPERQTGTE